MPWISTLVFHLNTFILLCKQITRSSVWSQQGSHIPTCPIPLRLRKCKVLPQKSCNKRAFTWRSNSVLPGGFVVTQGEKKCLDGANEDSSQEGIKYDIEQQDFCCQDTDTQQQFIRTADSPRLWISLLSLYFFRQLQVYLSFKLAP